MKIADKHFKFINSKTGYAIFYASLNSQLNAEDLKAELEKIRVQVSVNNGIYLGTIYWEEVKEETEGI